MGYGSGWGIAVDAAGNAYLTGHTTSPDFPTTPGAFQPTYGGSDSRPVFDGDAFVTKPNPPGSAQPGGGDQRGAGGIELGEEGVYIEDRSGGAAAVSRLERSRGGREG